MERSYKYLLLNPSVNSEVYQEILQTHLLPFLKKKLANGKFQQGNAPCHVSRATLRFLEDNNVPVSDTTREL